MKENQISTLKAAFLEGVQKGILRLQQSDFGFPTGLEKIVLPLYSHKEIKCSGLGIDPIDDMVDKKLVLLMAQIEGVTIQRERDPQALRVYGVDKGKKFEALLKFGQNGMICGRVIASIESTNDLCIKQFLFADERVKRKAKEIGLPDDDALDLAWDHSAYSLGALVGFGMEFDRQIQREPIYHENKAKQDRSIGTRIRKALGLKLK